MPRKTFKVAALFVVILLAFPALQRAQDVQPQARPMAVNGVTIPDIPDAPFSATAVIEIERYFSDGSSQVRRTINLIARDSQGRTHNETRRLMPEYFHGSPELMGIRLFDPLTRIRTTCDPGLHIARRDIVPKKPPVENPPNPSIHIQDLGTDTLNGLQAKGTRRTYSVSSREGWFSESVEIEDETWYSEDLHINLLVRHSDPRVGVQTIGVSGLKREEPPASMFQVPQGYRIIHATPTPTPVPATSPQPTAAGAVPNP